MKARVVRYLTESKFSTLVVTWSLIALLAAVAIQLAGTSMLGFPRFSQVFALSTLWLIPLRLLVYISAAYAWWCYSRRMIAASDTPELERRARNRTSLACILYVAALEYGSWTSGMEATSP